MQFTSHTLTPAEHNYVVNEWEVLACLWACKNWEKFLLGHHFLLEMDHSCLLSLLQQHLSTQKSAKFNKWLDCLSHFDYTIEYIKGKQNVVANALSCLPLPLTFSAVTNNHGTNLSECIAATSITPISTTIISQHTAVNPTLAKVISCHLSGWPSKTEVTPNLHPFFNIRVELSLNDNILTCAKDCNVVPTSLQRVTQALSEWSGNCS